MVHLQPHTHIHVICSLTQDGLFLLWMAYWDRCESGEPWVSHTVFWSLLSEGSVCDQDQSSELEIRAQTVSCPYLKSYVSGRAWRHKAIALPLGTPLLLDFAWAWMVW